jgi:hypothetical protein
VISSLSHPLVKSVLFYFYIFVDILVFLLLFTCSSFHCGQRRYVVISILLNLLRLALWLSIWSVLWNVARAPGITAVT